MHYLVWFLYINTLSIYIYLKSIHSSIGTTIEVDDMSVLGS